MKHLKTFGLLLLALVMAFSIVGCVGDKDTPTNAESSSSTVSVAKKTITVDVKGKSGSTKTFTIETTADNLEGALTQEKLIEGTQGDYGMFVTTVNGEKAVYETDHAYWSFCKDNVPLNTGVTDTKIADGEKYQIIYTPAE